jgi:FkbM family methyltransferase
MTPINLRFIRQVGLFRWLKRYTWLQFAKRVLRRDTRMLLPTGSRIVLPRQSQSATEVYVTTANTDWGSEALFAQFADRNRDFIDVGAHIGYYSAYLSPLIRRGYAFEPDPRNIPFLQINARLAGNIDIVQMAVSSQTGHRQLQVGGESAVSSLEGTGRKTIDTPVITIDDFMAARPTIDAALIKTDLEGHDLEALRGMRATVERCRPLILTECNNSAALLNLCIEWRYSIFAYRRDRRTLKLNFQQLSSAEELQESWYKMLFLVPDCLVVQFNMRRN